MIELARVAELRPARRAPDLLPARVGVGASTVSTVYQADGRGGDDLVMGIVLSSLLHRGVIAGNGVSGV